MKTFTPENTYYFANPEHADCIYGSQDPICIDINEVKNLAIGWDMTVEDLLDQMHEASEAEIARWGVYNG